MKEYIVKAVTTAAILMILSLVFSVSPARAQTTTFTYQGRLTSSSSAANGSYDFQFALFDALTGGTQIGGVTLSRNNVTVSGGLFTVTLDFGSSAFAGADRYLQISVKKTTDASFTPLTPRQQISSTPYAIQTLNAAQLGGVAANQFVQTTDSRLSDARPASSINFNTVTLTGNLGVTHGGTGLSASGTNGNFLKSNGSIWTSAPLSASDIPSGSGNYIRNTTTPQSADFNIGGTGTVGGPFSANTVSASSTNFTVFSGTSSSTTGSWLRLNNSSTGGHNWAIISTGSGNSEGVGKLVFTDQTSGGTRLQLDGTGITLHGNSSVTGDLTVNGTLNATVTTSNFASLPNCKARQTSAQTFPIGVFANVRLDETQFCAGVTFDNANDRLVIVTPGVYQISAEILFADNGNGGRFLSLSAGGHEVSALSINAISGIQTVLNCMSLVRLNAGDSVSISAAQGTGGTLNTDPFDGRSASLSINWVAP